MADLPRGWYWADKGCIRKGRHWNGLHIVDISVELVRGGVVVSSWHGGTTIAVPIEVLRALLTIENG